MFKLAKDDQKILTYTKTRCSDALDNGQCKRKLNGQCGKDHQKCDSLYCCDLCKY